MYVQCVPPRGKLPCASSTSARRIRGVRVSTAHHVLAPQVVTPRAEDEANDGERGHYGGRNCDSSHTLLPRCVTVEAVPTRRVVKLSRSFSDNVSSDNVISDNVSSAVGRIRSERCVGEKFAQKTQRTHWTPSVNLRLGCKNGLRSTVWQRWKKVNIMRRGRAPCWRCVEKVWWDGGDSPLTVRLSSVRQIWTAVCAGQTD